MLKEKQNWWLITTSLFAFLSFADQGVLQADTVKFFIQKEIRVGKYPQRPIFNPFNNNVYITNNGDGSVSIYSAKPETIIKTIPVSSNPWKMALSRDGKKLYVSDTDFIIVLDTKDDKVLKTIPSIYVDDWVTDPQADMIYILSRSILYKLDTLKDTIKDRYNFAGITLAINPKARRLYIGGSKTKVIDLKTMQVEKALSIPSSVRLILRPEMGYGFAGNKKFSLKTGEILGEVSGARLANGVMELDNKAGLFLSGAPKGGLEIYDQETTKMLGAITLEPPWAIYGIDIDPDTGTIYAVKADSSNPDAEGYLLVIKTQR